MGPSSPSPKRGQAPPPIFGPCLFWPNGLMDQDATWYSGSPRPGQHCVKCRPSSTPWEHTPQISAHVCCGQTAGWIKMPLGTKVGLCPGHIVLHGDSAPLPKGAEPPPQFLAHVYWAQTAGWINMPLAMEVGVNPSDVVLDGDPDPPPWKGTESQFSVHVYCGQMAAWIKVPLGMEVGLGPGHIVLDGDPAPFPKIGTSPSPNFCPCLLWPNG